MNPHPGGDCPQVYPQVLGVVLAAGASTRMGHPKALIEVESVPLVTAHIQRLEALVGEVRVVDGAVDLSRWVGQRRRTNARWASTGMWESLAIGLAGWPGPVIVTPVDAPPAPSADLVRLLATAPPATLAWHGQPGHPAYLGPAEVARIASEPSPSEGLAALLRHARRVQATTPDVCRNLNTPKDLHDWMAHVRS